MVVSRLFKQQLERSIHGTDVELTAGEARTLQYIFKSGKTRQKVLADAMSVEPMTLSSYVDRLFQLDLVHRSPDPLDRRAKMISLSEKGKVLHQRLVPIIESISDKVLEGMTPEQVVALNSGLDLMRANFIRELQ